jgi:hypothetical protein
MKKLTALLLCLAMTMSFVMLTGCRQQNTDPIEPSTSVSEPEDSSLPEELPPLEEEESQTPTVTETAELNTDGAYLLLDASDVFEDAFSMKGQKGDYVLTSANAKGYEDVQWSMFVQEGELDETLTLWENAEKGNLTELTGQGESFGSVTVEEAGKQIYFACSLNQDTAEESVEGVSLLRVDFVPAPEEPDTSSQEQTTVTVDANEAYDSSVYFFQAPADGTYQAVCTTDDSFDLSSLNCYMEQVEWTFYVLEEEFGEPARYLPQAYDSVLTGDGSFTVKKGQYVYCVSDINGFTAEEIPEGVSVLTLTLE